MMEVRPTIINGVIEIIPMRHADSRGSFCESYNEARFAGPGCPRTGCRTIRVSPPKRERCAECTFSSRPRAQAKLVRVLAGAIFDVAVDLRPSSPSHGRWVGLRIDAEMGNQLLIPTGFAHGFMTLEPATVVLYKVSALYAPEAEAAIAWDDPELAIDWPRGDNVLLSDKDAKAGSLAELRGSAAWAQIL